MTRKVYDMLMRLSLLVVEKLILLSLKKGFSLYKYLKLYTHVYFIIRNVTQVISVTLRSFRDFIEIT